MKKYYLNFNFYDTEEEAKNFIEYFINNLKIKNKYLYNKNKKIKILDWTSEDQTECKKLVWFYE